MERWSSRTGFILAAIGSSRRHRQHLALLLSRGTERWRCLPHTLYPCRLRLCCTADDPGAGRGQAPAWGCGYCIWFCQKGAQATGLDHLLSRFFNPLLLPGHNRLDPGLHRILAAIGCPVWVILRQNRSAQTTVKPAPGPSSPCPSGDAALSPG